MISVFDMVGNIVGKGENAGNILAFFFFPTMFSENFVPNDFKIRDHCGKVNPFGATEEKLFENNVGNGECAGKQHFVLFSQCFLPYESLIQCLE